MDNSQPYTMFGRVVRIDTLFHQYWKNPTFYLVVKALDPDDACNKLTDFLAGKGVIDYKLRRCLEGNHAAACREVGHKRSD